MIRKLALIGVAALAIAGCTTLSSIDDYIKKNLPIACSGLEVAHQAFLVANSARPFSATVLASEKAAYDNAKGICANPSAVNSVAVVATIFATVIQINGYVLNAQEAGVE